MSQFRQRRRQATKLARWQRKVNVARRNGSSKPKRPNGLRVRRNPRRVNAQGSLARARSRVIAHDRRFDPATRNMLARAGVHTGADLEMRMQEIPKAKGIGPKRLALLRSVFSPIFRRTGR